MEAPETSTAGSGLDWIVEVIIWGSQAMAVYFSWITWIITSSLIRWNEAKATFWWFYCPLNSALLFKGLGLEKWATISPFPKGYPINHLGKENCNCLAPVAADSSSGPRNAAALTTNLFPVPLKVLSSANRVTKWGFWELVFLLFVVLSCILKLWNQTVLLGLQWSCSELGPIHTRASCPSDT